MNNITIQPYRWEDNSGKHAADCFPFVGGKPCHTIAGCGFCTLYRDDADYCDGWKDEPENSPLFCGPICERFNANEDALSIIARLPETL